MTLELQNYDLIDQKMGVGGLNFKSAVTALADNESPYAVNMIYSKISALKSRNGFQKIAGITGSTICTGLYQLNNFLGHTEFYCVGTTIGKVEYAFESIIASAVVNNRTPTALYDFTTINSYAIFVNGVDQNLKSIGNPTPGGTPTYYTLGIPAPLVAPTAVVGGAGVLTGAYSYHYTYVNSQGQESNPSPVSATVNPAAQLVNLTIPVAPAPVGASQQVTARYIYRTEAGGTTYFRVGTIGDNITTAFADNIPDSGLGIQLEFDNNFPPPLSMIENHKDRLWGVDPNFPSNLLFSKQYREGQWPILNSIPVGLDDGDVITSLVSFFDVLVVFKRKSIYVVSGDQEFNFQLQEAQTDNRIGSVNNRCTAVVDNKVFFLSERGVYSFDGLRVKYESIKIEPIFDANDTTLPFHLNYSQASKACATNYKSSVNNWYYLAIPTVSSTTNDTILVFDTVINEWAIFTGITADSMTVVDLNNAPNLWTAASSNLYHQDYTNNDGWPHTAALTTGPNTFNTLTDTNLITLTSTMTAVGVNSITDTSLLGVSANQYAGYYITITSGPGAGANYNIISNTSTPVTFTFSLNIVVGPPVPGNQYQLGPIGVTLGGTRLRGVRIKIISGTGAGQIRTITNNTLSQFTVAPNWDVIPDTTSRYSLGFIEKEWRSKEINYGDADRSKRLVYDYINVSRENAAASNLRVSHYFDDSSGAPGSFVDANVSLTAGPTLYRVEKVRVQGGHIHRYVQIRLYNDVGGEPFTVNSLGLKWQLKGYR